MRDSGSIGGFRLDQPAGPTDPESPATTTPRTATPQPQPRVEPRPQPRPQPQAETPRTQPTPVRATPTPTQRTAPVAEEPRAEDVAPAAETPNTAREPETATEASSGGEAFSDTLDPQGADELADPAADSNAAAPTINPAPTLPDTGPDWGVIAPYALGAGALLLALVWFSRRRRKPAAGTETAEVEADTDALDLAVAGIQEPKPAPTRQPLTAQTAPATAPQPRPSGTVGIPIAKAPPPAPTPAPAPTLAERGFITTRAHQPETPAPQPARPSGTIGIPASRIAAPAPEPVVQLTEGTRLIGRLAAEELIRDDEGLRLRFVLTIANLGTMEARDVALRTVLLTAAPDSDRALAGWLANPTGDAATTIETIDSGTQTQVTGDIRVFADQIRPMRHGGEAVFVPMLAIALDFLGADGLDRSGDAFIIGQTGPKAANGIAAPVLPLPHEGALPRRWTDLAQRPAGLGALAKT